MAMKILYGVTKSNFGGAQRYVFELAEYTKSQGHEVFVTCGEDGLLVDKLREIDIPVFTLDSVQRDIAITKEIKTLWKLFQIMRKIQPDAVHLNSPKLGGLGSVVASLAGVKHIIYTNHGWPFMEHRPFWQILLIKFFSYLTILFNTKIIVLSEKELDMVIHWPLMPLLAKDKITIIANGVKEFVIVEKEHALEALLGTKRAEEIRQLSPIIFGNISELHQNKGYTYALQGIHTYLHSLKTPLDSHIHFVIVSDGEERDSLKSIVRDLNLESYVTFAGYITDARKYFKAFDICMMTSIKEGLPFTLLEAGYARVPIITTSVGGIPELIQDKETGLLIAPQDHMEIARAIQYAVQNQNQMSSYAERLKHRIDTSFSFDVQALKILKLYK
jgi:glycosyltransferase involved in cell wall biosynthesis